MKQKMEVDPSLVIQMKDIVKRSGLESEIEIMESSGAKSKSAVFRMFDKTILPNLEHDPNIVIIFEKRQSTDCALGGYGNIGATKELFFKNTFTGEYFYWRIGRLWHDGKGYETGSPGLPLVNEYVKISPEIGEVIEKHPPRSPKESKSSSEVDFYAKWGEMIHRLNSTSILAKEDLLHDLSEVFDCLHARAYRACLGLCGRCLEIVLKKGLEMRSITFDPDWMVGKLLSIYDEHGLYLDPAMKNVFNIINKQRLIGVHVKEAVAIPSEEQTLMVVYAILDAVNRYVLSQKICHGSGSYSRY